jgi:hypothetical protein
MLSQALRLVGHECNPRVGVRRVERNEGGGWGKNIFFLYNWCYTNFTTFQLIDSSLLTALCSRAVTVCGFLGRFSKTNLFGDISPTPRFSKRRMCRPPHLLFLFFWDLGNTSDALRATGVVCVAAVRGHRYLRLHLGGTDTR